METVSWDDCQQFVGKLNAKSAAGRGKFQLPSEAQWEYACRAGSKMRYCFGDDEKQLGEYAWYDANSGDKTHPVGEKKPNAWGLYDMHGNVWEWCQDWFDSGYYAKSPTEDPTGPAASWNRVVRGGCWRYPASRCRLADRSGSSPGIKSMSHFLGVRLSLVLTDKISAAEPKPGQTKQITNSIGMKLTLTERGFDRQSLQQTWDVSFCDWCMACRPAATSRIVIPVYRPAHLFSAPSAEQPLVLGGWQARLVPGFEVLGGSDAKYLSAAGMQKSELLYGLHLAINAMRPIYVVEGPADAWRVGLGAVALFGKDLSQTQKLLLVHHFVGRRIVVMLDQDAQEEARKIQHDLRLARAR